MHEIMSVYCVFDVLELCVWLRDLSMHQSKENKPNQRQNPPNGDGETGHKGPSFIALLQQRTNVLFWNFISLERRRILITRLFREIQEIWRRKENFVWWS